MQCRALHEGAVSSRNHVSWRRNRVSVKCQCPRYLTGALPCRRRSARPADRPARPAMNRLRRPCSSPASFPGRCPARGEQFAEDGRNGSRLGGYLRQFGHLCHADGARPAVRRPAVHPSGGAPAGRNGPLSGRFRPSGRAGCAGPEGSGRFLPRVRDPVRTRLRNPPVSPVANKPQIWNPAT